MIFHTNWWSSLISYRLLQHSLLYCEATEKRMGLSNGRSCLGYPWEWHLGGEARGDINMWGKGNERKCLCLVSNGSWMDCNQRLLPIYQPNSTLSGAIWKRDVLHTFLMEVRDWVALDCCGAGGDHFRFMLLDGWHGGWQTRYKKYFWKYKVQKRKKYEQSSGLRETKMKEYIQMTHPCQ